MDIQPLTTYPAGGIPQGSGSEGSRVSQGRGGAPDAVAVARESPAASASPQNSRRAGEEELQSAVKKVNEFVRLLATDLSFTVDESSGAHVVKVVDQATKDVIRQIPSEEMLAIARGLDHLQGLLVKQKA